MVKVKVDINELNASLRALSETAQNSSDMNAELADILATFVDDKFDREGPGWPPMRDLTKRLRRGGGGKLLQDTGLLAKVQTDSGPDFAEVFTNVEYAKYHLKGPRKLVPLGHKSGVWHLPVRDFFDIDINDALQAMADVITLEFTRI